MKVRVQNPSVPKTKKANPMARRRRRVSARRNPANPTNPTRRYRRRRNPSTSPVLMAVLGGAAGIGVGVGLDYALRMTTLAPKTRAAIQIGTGLAGGLALAFWSPPVGAGVMGGVGTTGAMGLVNTYSTTPTTPATQGGSYLPETTEVQTVKTARVPIATARRNLLSQGHSAAAVDRALARAMVY